MNSTYKNVAKRSFNLSNEDIVYLEKYIHYINIEWISLSKEIVCKDFCYSNTQTTMNDFYRRILCVKFKLDIDYKEDISKQNKYVITGECYMKVLLRKRLELLDIFSKICVKVDEIKMKRNTEQLSNQVVKTEVRVSQELIDIYSKQNT
jgi:hypothetical protein